MSDPIQTRLQEAIRLTTEALNMYSAPVISVSRGASLQVAIDKAPDGATLSIEPGVYQGSLNIPKPLTMMTSVLLPPGRVSSLTPMVTVIGSQAADAISVPGSRVSMQGIGASSPDPSRQLVGVTGSQFSMKQCSLVGDTNSGQHRGLMLNGDTALIGDCFIDNCFSVGRDAQAIGGWDGTKNITIDNCYLGGGGQSVMWGGADSTSSDRIPTNIAISRSTLSKNQKWFGLGAQIKCALELKAVKGIVVRDCLMEWAGISGGQGAYILVFTVRNQDGRAPWSTIKGVLVENCIARYGGGAVNVLGFDNNNPSDTMDNVVVRNVAFSQIDPLGPTGGAGRGILIDGGPKNLTFENVTIDGKNLGASMYLIPNPKPTGLVLRNLKLAASTYGMKIDGGGMGVPAWQQLMPDAVIVDTPNGTGASLGPTS